MCITTPIHYLHQYQLITSKVQWHSPEGNFTRRMSEYMALPHGIATYAIGSEDWIGLHLFNNDTRPSGHISLPTQLGFSYSYLCSINKVLWWCSVVEINSTWECRQLVTDLNKKLYWIYGLSYQIKQSSFSQKLYYASLGDRLKEGPQWVNCVVLITTLLQHCTFQEYVFNGQSLATILTSSRWSSGQNIGFCGLGMANSESGYHNFLSSGQVPRSLGWSKCWFQEIQISTKYRYIPLNLEHPLNVRVYQWLQICKVNSCQWVYVMVKGLLC